ncbi:MAG: hypothetical protein NC548_28535 [Lachnospiraceae bacterium]|nr:hypothetical protein [Lachnospiraceae bacterium]
MRKLIFVAMLICLTVCGCSHKGDDVETRIVEIALADNELLQLPIPANWSLTELDGFHYWKYNDDTTIYRSKTPVVTGDKKDNCWYSTYAVSRNFDEYTITITTNKNMVDTVGALLNTAKTKRRDVVQYKERGLQSLPEYKDYAMDFTSNGLYMPIDYNEVASDVFTSCHSMNSTSFVTCWIMNYKLDDLKPLLNNLVTCNSGDGKLSAWYESSDIYYAEAGNFVVAAKKLTYNQWCCYLSSNDSYADYLRKAIIKVKLN